MTHSAPPTDHMTHPPSPETLPASVETIAHAAVADLDRGSVGNLKMLLAVLEQLGWLGSYVPGSRGRTILRTVNQLAWRMGERVFRLSFLFPFPSFTLSRLPSPFPPSLLFCSPPPPPLSSPPLPLSPLSPPPSTSLLSPLSSCPEVAHQCRVHSPKLSASPQ